MSRSQQDEFGLLAFWSLALRLKQLRRRGWIDRGVEDPESAAAHSWGVALLAWLLARDQPHLNRERVLLLGLVHDLPEAVAGDATPFDSERAADGTIPAHRFSALPSYSEDAQRAKRDAEERALESMLGAVPASLANDVRDAWREYEERQTPEARFVWQVDKLETLLQAEEYRTLQPDLVIESFWRGSRRDVKDGRLVSLLAALDSRQSRQ